MWLSAELQGINAFYKFGRLWCSHRGSQIFDRTGYEFDLDFGIQIFERLAGD